MTQSRRELLAKLRSDLRRRPGYLLRRCIQETSGTFERACADVGVTARQYDYLFVLRQASELTQGEISRLLDVDRSTNALVISILEKKGYVRRWTDARDNRRKCIRLTDAGRHAFDQSSQGAQHAADSFFEALDDRERDQLLAYLNRIVDRLTGSGPVETERADAET